MNQFKQKIQPLYDSGDLLGFSVCGDEGEIVHNESFFSDERARQATEPFVGVMYEMKKAKRFVQRLTVEMDDVTLIYKKLDVGHTLFTFRKTCDLDAAAALIV